MRRIIALLSAAMLCLGMLAACGKESYDAQTNTVYILKKGKVVSKDVEDFDEEKFSASELEEYVRKTVGEYAKERGTGRVEFDSMEVKDNTASIILKYASAADYSEFTDNELFTGTVKEALEAGYSFEDIFLDAEGNKCDVAAVLDNSKLKVAVVMGNLNLHVNGEIVYYTSKNVMLLDKNTVSIDPAYEEEMPEGTESAGGTEMVDEQEQPTEGIIEETSGGAVDDGSVSDDEMLMGTEDTEVSFEFKDTHEERGPKKSEISDVYTYVVYK